MKYGFLGGRFQPFHKGHLYAVKEILKEQNEMIIGVVDLNLQGTKLEANPPEKNPFTWWERHRMIKNTLVDENIDLSKVNIIPVLSFHPDPPFLLLTKIHPVRL